MCKVALGKIYETKLPFQILSSGLPQGYHSVHYTGGVAEYVVYDDKQVSYNLIANFSVLNSNMF